MRHLLVSDGWNVHAADRARFMAPRPALVAEEKDAIDYGMQAFPHPVRAGLAAIGAAVGLDFFGVDCALSDEGVTLFEANATMNFFPLARAPQFAYLGTALARAAAGVRRAADRGLEEGSGRMNTLEWVAAGLGVVNVALVVRRSVWNYPFGLAMVSLYFFVFFEARLYSDALLQIFFFVVQLYGWRNWAAREAGGGGGSGRPAAPRRADRLGRGDARPPASLWGLGMARFTDAAAPMIDAGIAGTSIAAQILMARRRIENWVLWILVDIVAIGAVLEPGPLSTRAASTRCSCCFRSPG